MARLLSAGDELVQDPALTFALRVDQVETRLTMVHHVDERGAWGTRGRRIHHLPPGSTGWQVVAEFPFVPWVDFATPSAWARRAARTDRCNLYLTRSGRLLGIRGGQVFRIEGRDLHPLGKIRGDCIMNRSIAETPEGEIYFGEYFMNAERAPVRIFRLDPALERMEIAREMDVPRVRHVHAIHVDPYERSRLWLTCGDFENECYLVYSDDGFRSITALGDGSQTWRTVGLIFQESGICWMTDTHIAQNHAVSMDRATLQPRLGQKRDASTWYHAETTDGLYLATSCVEPGPFIQTRSVRLLASEDGENWENVEAWEKDRLPFRLFGFGFLSLPSGRYASDSFWLTGSGLQGFDGASRRCRLTREGSGP